MASLQRRASCIQSRTQSKFVAIHKVAVQSVLLRRLPAASWVTCSQKPETEEQRSPLDAPQEWEAPVPSRRPDIFPEFEKMERVFLPKPLPGDPEMPDEELEEAQKRTMPGDPDPEQKPGEPPEEPEKPADPSSPEPEKKTDIPSSPE